jgi:GT2 family glycosyltransferase
MNDIGFAKKISIIIPAGNCLTKLKPCVESVRAHTVEPCEIIVCDRGSTDGTLSWCRSQPLVLLSLPRHSSLADACSTGLRIASGDALMILGPDTIATPRWLQALTEALYSAAGAGLAGPVSNRAARWQQLLPPLASGAAAGAGGGSMSAGGLAHAGDGLAADSHGYVNALQEPAIDGDAGRSPAWLEVEHLDGFCVLMKREVWERCGPLPGGAAPDEAGMEQFCRRARLAGYRSIVARQAAVLRQAP